MRMKNSKYAKLLRIALVAFLDVLVIAAAAGLAMVVRFDFSIEAIPAGYKNMVIRFVFIQTAITLVVFALRKMYSYVWRTVSVYDVADMLISVSVAFVLSWTAGRLAGLRLPISVALIDLMCLVLAQVGMRTFLRFYSFFLRSMGGVSGDNNIMIIGAGEAGRMLMREISNGDKVRGVVRCIIDDNAEKWGKHMDGVPVVGGRKRIAYAAEKYNIRQIIFAIPTADHVQKRDILELCKNTGCKVRSVPGIYQMISGELKMSDVRDVQVEDLLGREPVQLDTGAVGQFLRNRVVLVTGGGGSIGSELCRQIAGFRPRKLIILDNYENNAYDIQLELKREYPELELCVEIATVRDKERTYRIFENYRPDVVFHAAAHKHVPLMEDSPEEAVKNNVFGTYHVVRAAERSGVKKFVMISTDKAVNPTNVMGATKRFCEMILQSRKESVTEFCAVRFGNVLGSNGSVVPLFKKQIEAGGPVTLTDKRIIRYFMTIPEAAQLVLEAGAMAHQGQIFVLDMGEPVKILTLAENLIRLSGLEPYQDIQIREIGLRPGEKLYEELLISSETLTKTANKKIFVEQQQSISPEVIMAGLRALDTAVTEDVSGENIVRIMKELVTSYHSPDEVNRFVGDEVQMPDEPVYANSLAGVGETE